MKSLLSVVLAGLALGAGVPAHAQSCGSGGGATVCLTATGHADSVQLSWTVSGSVNSFQVYRDTDSDPNGRSRIAQLAKSVTGYTDTAAVPGARYLISTIVNASK